MTLNLVSQRFKLKYYMCSKPLTYINKDIIMFDRMA